MSDWIRVEDELPDIEAEDGRYIESHPMVILDSFVYKIAMYCTGGEWVAQDDDGYTREIFNNVSHWAYIGLPPDDEYPGKL